MSSLPRAVLTIREGTQSFEYLTPRIKLNPKDLVLPPSPFTETLPEWIHVVSTTERIREIADELDDIRREGIDGIAKGWHAKLVWEPLSVSRFCPVRVSSSSQFSLAVRILDSRRS